VSGESPRLFSPQHWFLTPGGGVRPFWRALLFLLLGLVVILLVSPVLHPYGEGIKRAGWSAGLLLLTWFLLSNLDQRSFRTLGLWFYGGWWKEALAGLGLGVVLISTVIGALVLTGAAQYQGFSQHPQLLRGMALAGFLFLTAALFEELAFRGYAFQRWVESLGAWGAVALLAFLFGAGHMKNPHNTSLSLLNTILAGVLLAQTYLKTRGLWMAWGLHWSWNFFLGPVFALPVSGGKFAPTVFVASLSGPHWLSGGEYGPEGSILLTVVCGAAILGLWRLPWITPSPAMQEVLK
jgi:membrane protease YdiL (CAAX protease family)